MRGRSGRGEGAPPSALIPPPPPKPEGTPVPAPRRPRRRGRRGSLAGGKRPPGTRSVGGKARGAVPAGIPAGPRGQRPHGPSGTVTASRRPGCARSLRVLGDPSKEGARMRASVHCMSVERVFLLFSLCIALGSLRFLFQE